MHALSRIAAIAVPESVSLPEMGKTTNKHRRLDDSWCHSADLNYVKSLSFVAYTFDRRSYKLLIVKVLLPVVEGRRKVTLVTCDQSHCEEGEARRGNLLMNSRCH